MGNLRDRNDRAIRAYLSPIVASVGGTIPLYVANDSAVRKVIDQNNNVTGLIDILTKEGPESPKGSGNYMLNTIVIAKFPAAVQPGGDARGPELDIGNLIGAVHDALHMSDNNQDYAATAQLITVAGNALAGNVSEDPDDVDMVNYSCLAIVHSNLAGSKEQPSESNGINFIELISFQSNVVGYGGYWN